MVTSVIKRNGMKVAFDESKVVGAISRAFSDVYIKSGKEENEKEAELLAKEVMELVDKLGKDSVHVEEIEDIVEQVLMEKEPSVAKTYILYRHKRAEVRAYKASLGIQEDDLKLPINTLIVLAARYLLKDENGKIVESPMQMFRRVARAISSSEKNYSKGEKEVQEIEDMFYNAMVNFKFMPNSPTLMNAGTKLGQLSACFVLPVGDSIPEIFDSVKNAALIHQSGGGRKFFLLL